MKKITGTPYKIPNESKIHKFSPSRGLKIDKDESLEVSNLDGDTSF